MGPHDRVGLLCPLGVFLISSENSKTVGPKNLLITILGCTQAFIGWWMVKSGLSGEPSVSQYRLATHLGMAFIILGVLVWTFMDLVVGVGSRQQIALCSMPN